MHRARRRRDRLRPGQGRGDDRSRTSRPCSASCRPTPRSPTREAALRAAVAALVRADHRRRPDEHQRHGPAAVDRRRRRRRCPTACSTRSCCSWRSRSSPTARARPGSGGSRSSEAATADEAERVARAIANSPLVKTALYGHDPNWGRIAQAAGMALAGERARGARARRRSTPRRSAATRPRPRSRCGSGAARRARTCTSPTSPTSTSGSTPSTRHDAADAVEEAASSRPCSRRCPYIREFHGRTVVIKYGGAAMSDEALRDDFATDVVLLKYVGLNPVIVHGGGPDITDYMERLGMEVRFVEGVRVSDPATVEVAKMVLLGKVNSDIVMRLNRHGQPAVGLSGEDGALFGIRPHARADEFGFVGEIERVSVDVLNHIAEDYIPVIASVGVDARRQLLQRQRRHRRRQGGGGARRPQGDLPHRRRRLARRPRRRGLAQLAGRRVDEVEAALESVSGGMRPKLAACAEAVRGGVGSAHIIDGRRPHSLLLELFTDAGIGTMVTPVSVASTSCRRSSRATRSTPTPGRRSSSCAARGAALGRRRQGVPRLLRRALGPQRRPLPSADRRRDQRAGGDPGGELEPLLLGAGDAAGRAAGGVEPRRARLPLQLGRRGERVRDQAGPQARPRPRDRAPRDRHPRGRLPRPHARRRWPRPRSSPATTSSGRCPRASSRFRATIRRRCATRSASGPRR